MCEGHFEQSRSLQCYLEHKKLDTLISTVTKHRREETTWKGSHQVKWREQKTMDTAGVER